MIQAFISIKETDAQIQRKIAESVRDRLNSVFPKIINEIRDIVRKRIFDAISSSNVYLSIQRGDLQTELGLTDGGSRLIDILNIWLNNIDVSFKKFTVRGDNLSGGITIQAIRSDYSDVLDSNLASYISEKGEEVPWLRWLLLTGTSVIIADYGIKFGSGLGRTGGGIMIKGGSWGLSAEFAGGANDNFVTRAISGIESNLQNDIQNIIERNI